MKIKYGAQGFTLIELLVVIIIIGILAAIALPQYKLVVGKAKFATLKNDVRAIKSALDRYYLLHNSYTNNWNELDVEINSTCNNNIVNMVTCRKVILGSVMYFALGFSDREGRQACFIVTNPTNPYANRICQQETGIKVPQENYSTYKAYYY